MAYNLGSVNTAYDLGYTGAYTGITYPYELTSHGAAHPNSVLALANFASSGTVRFRVVSDFDPAVVIFDWQTISDNQEWRTDIDTLESVTVVAPGFSTATLEYFVVDSEAVGTFDVEVEVLLDLAGFIYTGTSLQGALSVALSFSGSLDQPGQLEGTLALGVAIGGTLNQGQTLLGNLALGLPLSPSPLIQPSFLAGSLSGVEAILGGELNQLAEFEGSLSSTLRVEGVLEQLSEFSGGLKISLPFKGQITQASALSGRLAKGLRLTATLRQPSQLLGRLNSLIALDPLPLQTRTVLTGKLTAPGLTSSGWLTLSDIYIYTDLSVDSIYFKPE